MYFFDTHVVAWLYQKELKLLSPKAKDIIEKNDVFISPVVVLELEYLFEIGRLKKNARPIIEYLQERIGLTVDDLNFSKLVNIALGEKWTRDPFDRFIVSHCKYRDAFLITKDKKISQNYPKFIF